jgi:mannose-6-phosphate isomerase-like protein (cupin superfamily)
MDARFLNPPSAYPATQSARRERSAREGIIIDSDRVLSITPFDVDMKLLLSSEATGGAASVIMACHKPGEGPSEHTHLSQDEFFFVIEGSYQVMIGEHTAIAGPGTLVYVPRNVVHRFKNVGNRTGRILDWSLPGGQEHYFEFATGGLIGEMVPAEMPGAMTPAAEPTAKTGSRPNTPFPPAH